MPPTFLISMLLWSVGNGLNINEHGKIERGEAMRTRQRIIDQAMGLLGRRFVLENHDLHAGAKHQSDATSLVDEL